MIYLLRMCQIINGNIKRSNSQMAGRLLLRVPIRTRSFNLFYSTALAVSLSLCTWSHAQESALPLLSGFDAERISACYPPTNEDKLGEVAKLLYRLRSVSPTKLQAMAIHNSDGTGEQGRSPLAVGDAASLKGNIKKMQLVPVPLKLREFLEFSQMQVLTIENDDGREIKVITFPMPTDTRAGDGVEGAGVALQLTSPSPDTIPGVSAIICNRLRWLPSSSPIAGWRLLRNQGVDISLLDNLGTRDRQPLLAEDADAFYSMMAAAAELGKTSADSTPPQQIAPVTLLQGSSELTGQWIQINLETVLITRISVTDPKRQAELASDHYYQIDAVGDLGKVVVQVERPDGEEGPPAVFNNRYPVSVVTRQLPDFLTARIREKEGPNAVICELRSMIQMDGFFFRLWSYETEFMTKNGGGDQFGPLLVAAEIRNVEPDSADPAGVHLIGSVAATAVILGILGIWIWQRRTDSHDRVARERKKEKEAETLRIP